MKEAQAGFDSCRKQSDQIVLGPLFVWHNAVFTAGMLVFFCCEKWEACERSTLKIYKPSLKAQASMSAMSEARRNLERKGRW